MGAGAEVQIDHRNTTMKTRPTCAEIAARLGITPAQARAGFLRNAASLRGMAAKADSTGRKVNGFTAAQLHAMAADAAQSATR